MENTNYFLYPPNQRYYFETNKQINRATPLSFLGQKAFIRNVWSLHLMGTLRLRLLSKFTLFHIYNVICITDAYVIDIIEYRCIIHRHIHTHIHNVRSFKITNVFFF